MKVDTCQKRRAAFSRHLWQIFATFLRILKREFPVVSHHNLTAALSLFKRLLFSCLSPAFSYNPPKMFCFIDIPISSYRSWNQLNLGRIHLRFIQLASLYSKTPEKRKHFVQTRRFVSQDCML